jgi:hypothetical protein
MGRNCNIPEDVQQTFADEFTETINVIAAKIGNVAFRNGKITEGSIEFSKRINPAIMDSLYTATYSAIALGAYDESVDLKAKYEELLMDVDFQDAISIRTTTVSQIKKRISKASEILFGVEYGW